MATLTNRWWGQIWVIQKRFPQFWMIHIIAQILGEIWGFTQIWVIRCSLWWNDYHSKLGDNCTHPSDLSDALKLREIKTPPIITQAFASQNINLVLVSNVYKMFNHMHQTFISKPWLLKMGCIMYMSYYHFFYHFPAITKLSPTFKHLVYNVNFILYLSHYPLLSIHSRRANQSQKILRITLSSVLGNHSLKLFITD